MTERLATSETPEEIGEFVASQFANGETHALVNDVPLYNERSTTKYNNNREESDDREPYYRGFDHLPQYNRHYLRYKTMLTICEKLATFETFYSENGESDVISPLQNLEVIGRRGAPLGSEKATTFHTEEPSEEYPSRLVSYWDAQPVDGKGEKIHILSVADILKWTTQSPDNRAFLATLAEPQEFYVGGRFKAPIYDKKAQTIRYNEIFRNSTASRGRRDDDTLVPPTKVEAFFKQAFQEGMGETVQLQPGSALFIDNHKAAHAVEFAVNPRRMTYKLLHYALKAEILAAAAEKQQRLEEAS